MPYRATQEGQVMVESSDKMWSTGDGNGKPLQYSCLENPMNSMKRQKDRTLKDELPRSVCALYATGNQWRNNSRENESTEAKQKQHPVVDVTGDRSKVRCCKEQYCVGTWNVRSMNQGVTQMYVPWFFVSSRDNKDLEQRTLKPSARHSSQVLDKPCYSS